MSAPAAEFRAGSIWWRGVWKSRTDAVRLVAALRRDRDLHDLSDQLRKVIRQYDNYHAQEVSA